MNEVRPQFSVVGRDAGSHATAAVVPVPTSSIGTARQLDVIFRTFECGANMFEVPHHSLGPVQTTQTVSEI